MPADSCSQRQRRHGLGWAVLWVVLQVACGPSAEGPGPTPSSEAGTRPAEAPARHPRPEILEMLREDLARPRGPEDGQGRAWIADADPARVAVEEPGRWTVVYEAGANGVAVEGWIFFQVSPFWGWSSPQTTLPEAPGYTEVTTSAEGTRLFPVTVDSGLLGLRIEEQPLGPGERVSFVYGAGPAGARADRYAESGARFWVSVDGDGDGVRATVDGVLAVDVGPGPAVGAHLVGPSVVRPGEPAPFTLALLDGLGNAALGVEAAFEVTVTGPAGRQVAPPVAMAQGSPGQARFELSLTEPGVYRVEAVEPGLSWRAESNPVEVTAAGPRVRWADLHGHSQVSDGSATPEEYFRYARDVAALDVVALTDHDHWGMEPLSQHPEVWQGIREQVTAFHDPGRFVTLLGYEWTSWIHGHRHVLYFGDQGEVLSSVSPEYDSPGQLWDALRGRPALTLAHHSAGGPIATDWSVPPDPELEPVTEVVSVHGSSEAPDAPFPIYSPIPGNYVRDALGLGYRLGFVGSGDSHDGHPGLAQLGGGSGGLAAVLSDSLTREGILEALRRRRVYATNGPRILLRVALAGHPMGSELAARDWGEDPELFVQVSAAAPIQSIDLVQSGQPLVSIEAAGERDLVVTRELPALSSGGFVYVRVVQEDGGCAWSSPFFSL